MIIEYIIRGNVPCSFVSSILFSRSRRRTNYQAILAKKNSNFALQCANNTFSQHHNPQKKSVRQVSDKQEFPPAYPIYNTELKLLKIFFFRISAACGLFFDINADKEVMASQILHRQWPEAIPSHHRNKTRGFCTLPQGKP